MEAKLKKGEGSFWILGKKRIISNGNRTTSSSFKGKSFDWCLTVAATPRSWTKDKSEPDEASCRNATLLLKPKSLRDHTEVHTNIRFGGLLEGHTEPSMMEVEHIFTFDSIYAELDLGFSFSQDYKWIYCGIEIIDDSITPALKTQIANNATFVNELKQLYYEDETKDVTIKVGGGELRAHKIILTSRSPVFRGMFNARMKERNTGVVTIPEFSTKTFSILLEFIYTNSCSQLENVDVEETLRAADMYQVIGLKNLCGAELLKDIDIENALDILTLLDRYHVKVIKESAVAFIFDNKDAIFKDNDQREAFESNNPELAAQIYYKFLTRDMELMNFDH